jgi:hypothetical protein
MNFGVSDTTYPATNTQKFHDLQFAAMIELNKLINGYVAMRRGNAESERVDHSLTIERKTMLQGIKAVDKDGNIYYDKMLEFARKAIEAFGKEDVQR